MVVLVLSAITVRKTEIVMDSNYSEVFSEKPRFTGMLLVDCLLTEFYMIGHLAKGLGIGVLKTHAFFTWSLGVWKQEANKKYELTSSVYRLTKSD